ncbi:MULTISPECIES: DUF6414 family protein [Pseudomonas]|uniref:Uncharacterized protein n=1 Tax=Pseudomonas mosselii TaxID=78327 RepID=A0A5R8YZT0_9PSED|nr:hypothetical protein [Pseudomonas mosselii]TLP59048.1 hypothetical protein FEM01_14170 [Pseudomonas mosselii]
MKNFIYLDRFKVYSLSSQLMSGVTEYILEEKQQSLQENEEQKGPVGSGRIIAEIIEKTASSVEKKFLHDYAYSLFESRLKEDNKLLDLTGLTYSDVLGSVSHGQLVKVKGKAKIVDYLEVVRSLKAMESIMPSLGVVTSNDERTLLAENLDSLSGAAKSEAIGRLKKLNDIKNFRQSEHTNFFQKHLSEVMEYAFDGALELEVGFDGYKVSADLNRDHLREPINTVVKKYSRFTEVEFCMVGVVTQVGAVEPVPEADEVTEEHNMREAISITTAAIAGLERSFRCRPDNEIIVDPIAIFTEL